MALMISWPNFPHNDSSVANSLSATATATTFLFLPGIYPQTTDQEKPDKRNAVHATEIFARNASVGAIIGSGKERSLDHPNDLINSPGQAGGDDWQGEQIPQSC